MKYLLRFLLLFSLTCLAVIARAEDRFSRPVVKVRNPDEYQFVKLDDVKHPTLQTGAVIPVQSPGPGPIGPFRQKDEPNLLRWDRYVTEASNMFNRLDKDLIYSVMLYESQGRRGAVSPTGAAGPMQLTKGTAEDMGVKNRLDPRENIIGGTRRLAQLLERYRGNLELAIAAYNRGEGEVDRNRGIPPAAGYNNTPKFVRDVIEEYRRRIAARMQMPARQAVGGESASANDRQLEQAPFP